MAMRDKILDKVTTLDTEIAIRAATKKALLEILEADNAPATKRKYKKRTKAMAVPELPKKAKMPMPIHGEYSRQEVIDALKSAGKKGATSRELLVMVNIRRPKKKAASKSVQNSVHFLWNSNRTNMQRKKTVQPGNKRPCYRYFWRETPGALV